MTCVCDGRLSFTEVILSGGFCQRAAPKSAFAGGQFRSSPKGLM
jgi:hypothetical protein